MSNGLEKLELKHFRGATTDNCELVFDPRKRVTLIYGENGTGKSTIVDALDFVCNKGLSGFEAVSGATIKDAVTVGRSYRELEISLFAFGKSWKAGFQSVYDIYVDPDNAPLLRLLRRNQILRFIDSKPSDRYESLKEFIELPRIQICEDSLRKQINTTKRDYENYSSRYENDSSTLRELWESEGSPGKDFESWARDEAGRSTGEYETIINVIDPIIDAITGIVSRRDDYVSSKQAREETEKALSEINKAYVEAKKEFEEIGADQIIDILRQANDYFKAVPDADLCPVCEQPIQVKELIYRIEERLCSLQKLTKAKEAVGKAKQELIIRKSAESTTLKQLLSKAIRLSELIEECDRDEIKSLKMELFEHSEEECQTDDIDQEIISYAFSFVQCSESIKPKIESIKAKTEQAKGRLNNIKTLNNSFLENHDRAMDQHILLNTLNAFRDVIEGERKEYVEGIMSSIAEEVVRLFDQIHSGEDLSSIQILLDPKRKSSINIKSSFMGYEVNPQAYYSESHLDTLGICVFLALAKKLGGEGSIVILDDVLTSVDHPHLRRIINMLCEQFDVFKHVIITTHFEPLYERFRTGRGPTHKIEFIKLEPWSPQNGLSVFIAKKTLDELKDSLERQPFDKQAVSSKAAVLYENVTKHLSQKYRLRLPYIIDGRYALSELSRALMSKRLRGKLKIKRDEEAIDLCECIDAIDRTAFVRNDVGAHSNIDISVLQEDVVEFGKAIVKFVESISCPACGNIPGTDKSGSYWECYCGATHLYPMVM